MLMLLGLLALFAGVTAAVNAATSDDDTGAGTSQSTTGNGGDGNTAGQLVGAFTVSGSSTVEPIVRRQAEEYEEIAPGVAISVEGPGTGDGAVKFCSGDVPIGNGSRQYKDEELAECEANGIEFIELLRGIDGITVITSTKNTVVDCISFNDLYALVSEEATGFDDWSDANALTSTWGGSTLPDAELDIFGPGEESGTFDSFAEIVIESVAKGKTGLDPDSREFVDTIRPDYNSSPDDNTIITGIESSQYSLGWVGYAFAKDDDDRAKLLQVKMNDDGACVTPTPNTIASAEFPIARFLYTYVNLDAVENEPGVAEFVDYMLSDTGLESVSAAGYVDLSGEDQAAVQETWANRTTGKHGE